MAGEVDVAVFLRCDEVENAFRRKMADESECDTYPWFFITDKPIYYGPLQTQADGGESRRREQEEMREGCVCVCGGGGSTTLPSHNLSFLLASL